MTTPARDRRENQPVPTTMEGAFIRFKCEAYLCTMSGNTCRDQHLHAAEFRPENRDACIDCPAGAARARLLGAGSAAERVACAGKTAKGAPCPGVVTVGATDGLCHGCNGGASGRATRTAQAKVAKVPMKKRPTCKRSGCARDTVPGTLLDAFCRDCFNSAGSALKISMGRKPTDDERAKWLARTPAHRRPAALSLPQMPMPDVHVAVSPEAVDQVLAEEYPSQAPEFIDPGLASFLQRQILAMVPGSLSPPLDAPTTDVPAAAVPPVCAPEPPAGNAERTAVAVNLRAPYNIDCGDGYQTPCTHLASVDPADWAAAQAMWRVCSDCGEVVGPPPSPPPDVATVRVSLNSRAYAELERMAATGVYGDDPSDVARTLILDGLRWALVRT